MQNYWIFQYTEPVLASILPELEKGVTSILSQWKAHGTPLDSEWRLIENQILFIRLQEDSEGASGCSIDSLRKQMNQLHQNLNLEEAGAGQVFFKTENGLNSVAWNQIEAALSTGVLHPNSLIADTTTDNLALPEQLFRPLGQTWIKKYL